MKLSIIFSVISAALLPTALNAQSAKFSAGWRSNENELAIATPSSDPDDSSGDLIEKLATIKSAQNKELLIGLSGVINLLTFTEAKGKNGEGKVTAVADAAVQGKVVLVPEGETGNVCGSPDSIVAAPGMVPFSARTQTLTVDTALTAEVTDSELEVIISGYVEVGLTLDTTAAHHFNFVAYDLTSDVYDVYACWSGAASGSVSGGEGDYAAAAAIKKRMLTVQAVRAVKTDGDIDVGNGNL